jgi:hypothetical protein
VALESWRVLVGVGVGKRRQEGRYVLRVGFVAVLKCRGAGRLLLDRVARHDVGERHTAALFRVQQGFERGGGVMAMSEGTSSGESQGR